MTRCRYCNRPIVMVPLRTASGGVRQEWIVDRHLLPMLCLPSPTGWHNRRTTW